MMLPKNVLSDTYRKPDVYLCEADKTKMCKLETSNMQASLKFNAYSELSFEVSRFYSDIITGETQVNSYYDLIEALRLLYVEGFGYFEIQGPEMVGDGIKETKAITAYSYEYTLSQKYLENFYVNTGEVDSIEVINAESENQIIPVTLYNPTNTKLSLLHLILEKDYAGWKVGHIDPQLKTLSRQFEIDRTSIYDFLMNEICEKFNCYITFDTINNTINIYAESPTAKFIGDGTRNTFTIENGGDPFSEVQTVSIDGYKTTRWSYGIQDGVGILVLEDAPESGAMIEVIGVDSSWETDVFVSFDNLSQEIKVNYDSDEIKTVLTVTFGDDNDIREVNLGLPYIVDLSYYCTPEWLGQDLYDDWVAYQEKCNSKQAEYTKNTQDMLYYAGLIDHEENRLSLGYAEITVDENSVGTYYVRGGAYPNYYYTEVSLPAEYNVNTTYYSTKTTNLEDGSDGNVAHLYESLKKYFMYADDWKEDLDALAEEFDFMGENAITNLSAELSEITTNRISVASIESTLSQFFATMWNEIGRTPLKQMFYEPYKKVQITNMEAGWSQQTHEEYGNYYTVILLLNSIETAISVRDKAIASYESIYKQLQAENASISQELVMTNNFTENQLVRLNAFLREDELHLDDIITTDQDSIADTYKNQQDALEAGRIELSKLSRPQLQFSMSMANIYALPEFEPIIEQFQLGNIVKVAIRPGYIQQARLLQVDINFDDFSDFSCEFGELTNLRSQSDIHADLLKNAISAGKSVAQNASYWTKGSDQANSIDLRLQEGLLGSIEALKAIDGSQHAYMDKYGVHLEVVNPETGEIDDKRVWMVNNQIVFTDDGFKTSKSVLGEFTVDGETYYGLLAQAVIAGLVEGSAIRGGTIHIGEYYDNNGQKQYHFSVDALGHVTMNAASISGYVTSADMNSKFEQEKDKILLEVSNEFQDKLQHYGVCYSEGDERYKIIECDSFTPTEGSILVVRFAYGNNASNPILCIGDGPESIEAQVCAYDQILTADSEYNWTDNSIVTFVYGSSGNPDDASGVVCSWNIADNSSEKIYSRILITADAIRTEVGKTLEDYSTTGEINTTLQQYSTTKQTKDLISSEVSSVQKYVTDNYSTTTEMNSAIDQKADSITSTVSATYATLGQVAHYGTCSTPASTRQKVVACDGFTLYKGATVSVRFTNSNTSASPQLNVNNTGDKTIMAYNGSLSSTSGYNWSAYSTVSFVYDGTYWRMMDSGALEKTSQLSTSITQTAERIEAVATDTSNLGTRVAAVELTASGIESTVSTLQGQVTHYGQCETAADVAAKIVTCPGFSLYKGATIAVKFTYATSVSKPTLNVNNTGDKYIAAYGVYLMSASAHNWSAGSVVNFVYNGSYWDIADSGALSKIKQASDSISLKVDKGDLGTLIEQNYEHVRIAWNNNSNYVQFEDGAMCIYTSSTHSSNTLLMKHDYSGAWYYNSGTTVGCIGTNKWHDDDGYRGLVFDLAYAASYMCWAAKDSASADNYTAKLIYHHKSTKQKKGLHFCCNTYADGYLYLNDTVMASDFDDGSAGLAATSTSNTSSSGKGVYIQAARNDGYVTRFSCWSDMYQFSSSSSKTIKCYNNIDMCGYSILNQSDARLKTNIDNAEIDAVGLINQIEMKKFDWIDSGEHEDVGIIAQQLQTIAPSLVHEDPLTGKLSIKTDKFIPYLVKAVQELTECITGGTSTFSLCNQWSDPYTDEEKDAFVARTAQVLPIQEDIKHEPVLIPINNNLMNEEQKENLNE